MVKKGFTRRLMAAVLSCVLLVGCVSAAPYTAEAHGTTDTVITEDMLKGSESIPADYALNQETQGAAKDGTYDRYFLKEDVQEVRIKVDENNLNYLLQNAGSKPTVMTDSVTIGDQTVRYTGLKTKGNYTLNATNQDDTSDRFSFTVNFGKYIKKKKYGAKQNFFGANKISFNNFYFDRSMMVEYFAMRLMTEMGIPTPQYGLAKLYINDQFYGVYFMVEAMDSSIIEQAQNIDVDDVSDYLTKPADSTSGSSDGSKLKYTSALDSLIQADGTFDLSSVLKKNDNKEYEASGDLLKQQALWEGDSDTLQDVAETLPTVLSWEKKLNQLSSGKNFSDTKITVDSDEYVSLLNELMDVDEVIRYFAVHSFLVQLDDMFQNYQNYGLYVDAKGKATVIPWDYDLSFGRYHPGNAEETANYDIDCMYWDMRNYSDFPLFNVIYQNKSLMKKYHQYMKDCSKIAALGGVTSDGRSYDAGYFNSYIETMTPKLKAAITADTMASNVSYLNGQNQPSDAMTALPNLAKVITMRAAGVAAQVEEIKTTVSGSGCNLGTVGNADPFSYNSSNGDITNIDVSTGITIRSTYGDESDNSNDYWMTPGQWQRPGLAGTAPTLTVSRTKADSGAYKEIVQTLNTDSSDITIYHMTNAAEPKSTYTFTIPVSAADKNKKLSFYSFASSDGLATELKAEALGDNRYSMKTKSIAYVAVVADGTSNINPVTKGTTYAVNGIRYKITKTGQSPQVTLMAAKKKSITSVTVGDTVKMNGKAYKITAIAANAFKNCKKLKKASIGANVSVIGKKAFYGCKNLKKITIKTTKLTASKVGSQAFKGTAAKAVVKVPAKKVKAYKKMLLKKGIGKKAEIKK